MVLLLNQLTKKEDKEPKSKDIFKGIIQRIPIKKHKTCQVSLVL